MVPTVDRMAEAPAKSSLRVLDPMERISEVLFGLIMVLVVTGSISIAADEHAKIRTMLVGALGCNLAWGIIDAGMYLLAQLNERGRAILLARGAAGRRGIEPRGDIGFGWNLDAKGA